MGYEKDKLIYVCEGEKDPRDRVRELEEEVKQLMEIIASAAVALGADTVDTKDPHCLANEIAHVLSKKYENRFLLSDESVDRAETALIDYCVPRMMSSVPEWDFKELARIVLDTATKRCLS